MFCERVIEEPRVYRENHRPCMGYPYPILCLSPVPHESNLGCSSDKLETYLCAIPSTPLCYPGPKSGQSTLISACFFFLSLLLFFFLFFFLLFLEFKLTIIYLAIDNKRAMIIDYGTPKLTYVVIFLVVLSKNCVNLSMHYVIVLKTRVVLSIYNVDMPTLCLIMLKNYFILSQRGVILSKKHVNLSI